MGNNMDNELKKQIITTLEKSLSEYHNKPKGPLIEIETGTKTKIVIKDNNDETGKSLAHIKSGDDSDIDIQRNISTDPEWVKIMTELVTLLHQETPDKSNVLILNKRLIEILGSVAGAGLYTAIKILFAG